MIFLFLTQFPYKYEKYEDGQYENTYRRMVVDDYLVFYVVLDDVIEYTAFYKGKETLADI